MDQVIVANYWFPRYYTVSSPDEVQEVSRKILAQLAKEAVVREPVDPSNMVLSVLAFENSLNENRDADLGLLWSHVEGLYLALDAAFDKYAHHHHNWINAKRVIDGEQGFAIFREKGSSQLWNFFNNAEMRENSGIREVVYGEPDLEPTYENKGKRQVKQLRFLEHPATNWEVLEIFFALNNRKIFIADKDDIDNPKDFDGHAVQG